MKTHEQVIETKQVQMVTKLLVETKELLKHTDGETMRANYRRQFEAVAAYNGLANQPRKATALFLFLKVKAMQIFPNIPG